MTYLRTTFYSILLTAFLTASPVAQAQEALRIAAIVNDQMVSIFDIDSRMRLVIHLANLPNTIDTKKRLARQLLRSIIDDKLKMQEAKRLEISASRKELQAELSAWEKRSGLSKGGSTSLVRRLGIDKSAIIEQMETLIVWRKIIRLRFLRAAQVREEEVNDIIAEEEKRTGQPEYLVSEIFLPVSKRGDFSNVMGTANRLIQQLQSGAKFNAIARNFSQSPTAATGGDLGWNRVGQLATELDRVVRTLQPTQISAPIQTLDGVYILNLRGKRAIQPYLEKSTEPETVTLYQVHFNSPENAPPTSRAAVIETAQNVTLQARNCNDMAALGKKFGSPLSGPLGKLNVAQLSPQLRQTVSALATGTASPPVQSSAGVSVLMVCERTTPTTKKIDRKTLQKKIRTRLIKERLNLSARRLLRSLRQAALVDIRI